MAVGTALVAAAGVLAACGLAPSTTPVDLPPTVKISSASSLRVIDQAAQESTALLPQPVTLEFNHAGSSTLVHQLAAGLPSDLLITASADTMARAVDENLVGSPVLLASNHMVLIVPAENPASIHSVTDITPRHVVAKCDSTVPCGEIADQIIAANGYELRFASLERQVADVVGRVVSGQADAGFVYSTDAKAAGERVATIELPGATKYRNHILGAVTTNATHPDQAGAVLELFQGNFSQHWHAAGFTVPQATG
ncbi:hypothetical protein CPHO_07605 [Corynebacterium phocae]|uniref:Molybdate-binding protein n=1 Tax=Corynebacterium phocae TaxID=161895 RepID=A0A1L7D6W2_9CORY|nr:hypothetical protein CPHO_07605 [Corynebacterium phocae]